MSEHKIPIPAMLYNAAVGGHVTNSQQIIDENLNREQNDINQETVGAVPYNSTIPNGMGRIVLKKNDNFKTVVEEQTNGNTIFIIKYDFILTGDVTIPVNCILEFDGGSVSGEYTITFSNTAIIGLPKLSCSYAGTITTDGDITYFGASTSLTDNGVIINMVANIAKNVIIPKGTYTFTTPIIIHNKNVVWEGKLLYTGTSTTVETVTIRGWQVIINMTGILDYGGNNRVWSDTGRTNITGLVLENIILSTIRLGEIYNFNTGVIVRGNPNAPGQSYCTGNNTYLTRILDCNVGIFLTDIGNGWNNANYYYEGLITITSSFDRTDVSQVVAIKIKGEDYEIDETEFHHTDIESTYGIVLPVLCEHVNFVRFLKLRTEGIDGTIIKLVGNCYRVECTTVYTDNPKFDVSECTPLATTATNNTWFISRNNKCKQNINILDDVIKYVSGSFGYITKFIGSGYTFDFSDNLHKVQYSEGYYYPIYCKITTLTGYPFVLNVNGLDVPSWTHRPQIIVIPLIDKDGNEIQESDRFNHNVLMTKGFKKTSNNIFITVENNTTDIQIIVPNTVRTILLGIVAVSVLDIDYPEYVRIDYMPIKTYGPTSDRPTDAWIGFQYNDVTLGKNIIWNGSNWINLDGSPLT